MLGDHFATAGMIRADHVRALGKLADHERPVRGGEHRDGSEEMRMQHADSSPTVVENSDDVRVRLGCVAGAHDAADTRRAARAP